MAGSSKAVTPLAGYWPWILLALALHAAVLFAPERNLHESARYDVAAGESATDVDLTAAPKPAASRPSPAPAPTATPTPVPVPPKPDDIPVPRPEPTRPSERPVEKHRMPPARAHPGNSAVSARASHSGGASSAKPGYLQNPAPPYPESARDDREQGVVQLMVSVGENGRVQAVRLMRSCGFPDLDQSALRTVRSEWRFSPAREGGVAVPSSVLVPIHFRLEEQAISPK